MIWYIRTLRRRDGKEEEEYPSEELRKNSRKNQRYPSVSGSIAMNIAIVAADFTPAEADELRRSMATFKSKGIVSKLRNKLINGMTKKGYEKAFAERIFKQLEGFGSYGFPESHAASFALLVYVSSFIKYHHPDVFAAALLNSQPMGFYRPAQIVIDAQNHKVKVRPIDINHSFWDNTLENIPGQQCALRLGFRQVKGLKEEEMQLLVTARTKPFTHSSINCSTPAFRKLHWKNSPMPMHSDLSVSTAGRHFGKHLHWPTGPLDCLKDCLPRAKRNLRSSFL